MAKTKLAQPMMDKMPEKNPTKFDDYEVDHAMDTLTKAEEIKKNPHLMKHVHKKAGHKMKAIKSIQDLRDLKNDMDEDDA